MGEPFVAIEPWEPLDADGHDFFGVFDADDYTPRPIAIFSTKEDAEEWLEFKRAHPDENRRGYHNDICVLVIRDLSGRAWNHMDDAPSGEEELRG